MNRNLNRNTDASFLIQNIQARTVFADLQARKAKAAVTGVPIRGSSGFSASDMNQIAEGTVETSTTTRDAIVQKASSS
jgi:hypothetical protein